MLNLTFLRFCYRTVYSSRVKCQLYFSANSSLLFFIFYVNKRVMYFIKTNEYNFTRGM